MPNSLGQIFIGLYWIEIFRITKSFVKFYGLLVDDNYIGEGEFRSTLDTMTLSAELR